MKKEYYPTPKEILLELGLECVLVGSATSKPTDQCKDIDFVVSDKGIDILRRWDRYLIWDSPTWAVLMPYEDGEHLCFEFFNGICAIVDEGKWESRITYDQATSLPLCVKIIEGVEVLSLTNGSVS